MPEAGLTLSVYLDGYDIEADEVALPVVDNKNPNAVTVVASSVLVPATIPAADST